MALPATFDEFAKLGTTGNSTEIRHIPTGFTFSVPANATVDTVYDTFDAIEETAAFDRFTQGGMLQRKQGTVVGRPQLEFESLNTGTVKGVPHTIFREVNTGVTFTERSDASPGALRLAYMDAAEGQGRSMTFDEFTKQTQPSQKQEAETPPSGTGPPPPSPPPPPPPPPSPGITYNRDDHRAAAIEYAKNNPDALSLSLTARKRRASAGGAYEVLQDLELVPSNWYNLLQRSFQGTPSIPAGLAAFWVDAHAEGQLQIVGAERGAIMDDIKSLQAEIESKSLQARYLESDKFKEDKSRLADLGRKKLSYDNWLRDTRSYQSQVATDYARGMFDDTVYRTRTFWTEGFQPLTNALGSVRDGSGVYGSITDSSEWATYNSEWANVNPDGTKKEVPQDVSSKVTAPGTGTEKEIQQKGVEDIFSKLREPGEGALRARQAAFEDFTPTQTWERLAAEGQLGFAPTRELSPFARQAVTGQFRDIYQPGYATQLAQASQELAAATEAAQEGQQMPTTFAGLPLDAPAGVSPFHSFVSGVQESGRMPAYNVDPIRAVLESGRVDPYSTRLIGMLGEGGLENITTQNIALLNQRALQGLSPTLRAAAIQQLKDQYTQDILLQPEMTAFAHFGMQNPAGSFALGMPQRTVPEPPGI